MTVLLNILYYEKIINYDNVYYLHIFRQNIDGIIYEIQKNLKCLCYHRAEKDFFDEI